MKVPSKGATYSYNPNDKKETKTAIKMIIDSDSYKLIKQPPQKESYLLIDSAVGRFNSFKAACKGKPSERAAFTRFWHDCGEQVKSIRDTELYMKLNYGPLKKLGHNIFKFIRNHF